MWTETWMGKVPYRREGEFARHDHSWRPIANLAFGPIARVMMILVLEHFFCVVDPRAVVCTDF